MTENKPTYHAQSGTTEMTNNQFPYIETPSDTLLVIPILHSGLTPDDTPVCLHLIHLDNGKLGLCSATTTQVCGCCRLPMCDKHQSQLSIDLPHDFVQLCETCAALPRTQLSALHAFATTLNSHVEVHP